MGSFSIWHWMIILGLFAFYFAPLWLIVRKAGYHPALSLLALVPLVNVVLLWVFALGNWPALKDTRP